MDHDSNSSGHIVSSNLAINPSMSGSLMAQMPGPQRFDDDDSWLRHGMPRLPEEVPVNCLSPHLVKS